MPSAAAALLALLLAGCDHGKDDTGPADTDADTDADADAGIWEMGLGDADAKLLGTAEEDHAGHTVAFAGDFDGDGFGDVLVDICPSAHDEAARACVVFGPLSGQISLGDADLVITEENGDTVRALASAGDQDGNSGDDVLVGTYEGTFLFLGPRTGTVALADADATFTAGGGSFDAGADADGDGWGDVLVGKPQDSTGGSAVGAVWVVPGPLSGTLTDRDAAAMYMGEAIRDMAGSDVAWVGDVDGDGFEDALIGAYGSGTDSKYTGKAHLVLGPFSGTRFLLDAQSTWVGEEGMSMAGVSVAAAGDVDGNGLPDLLVGAPYYALHDLSYSCRGAAYLVLSPSTGRHSFADSDARLLGEHSSDHAGMSVAGLGDVDGDGFADVLVGGPGSRRGGANDMGATWIVRGPVAGTNVLLIADGVVLGEDFQDASGSSVAAGGDVDGDGRGDILIGAPWESGVALGAGAAYLVLGGSLPW